MGVKEQKHVGRWTGSQRDRGALPSNTWRPASVAQKEASSGAAQTGRRGLGTQALVPCGDCLLRGPAVDSHLGSRGRTQGTGDGQASSANKMKNWSKGLGGEGRHVPVLLEGPQPRESRGDKSHASPCRRTRPRSPSRIRQLPADHTPSAPPVPGASLKPVLLLNTCLLSSEIIGSEAITITPALERRCRY